MKPTSQAAVDPAQVLTKALFNASQLLGFNKRELARILGTSPSTVSRLEPSRPLEPGTNEGARALLFLRIFRSLDALVGGREEQARAWLHADNQHLGGVPAERLTSIEGLVHVADYLDAMRGNL